MRVLVTGSSGFLGAHLVRAHLASGNEVVGFDLQPVDPVGAGDGAAEVVVGDVRDLDALVEAMRGCEAVYHLAAVADIGAATADPRRAADVNVMGTATALEACRIAGIDRLILASSVYVHSAAGSVYRTTKRAAEALVRDCAELWGLRTTILRFGSVYGPGADPENAIRRIITMALSEGRIDFWGDGTEVREYIHAGDAARLAVRALDDRFAGRTLHLVGWDRLTTREVVEMVAEMVGSDVAIEFADSPYQGRYHLTPYTLKANDFEVGERLTDETHVDLGLGILDTMQHLAVELGVAAAGPNASE
jgi:UDP-glucose 4-epimerase